MDRNCTLLVNKEIVMPITVKNDKLDNNLVQIDRKMTKKDFKNNDNKFFNLLTESL